MITAALGILVTAMSGVEGSGASVSLQVEGEGYLRFSRQGRAVYAKGVQLVVRDGCLANQFGDPVLPSISASSGALRIAEDGVIWQGESRLGRLVLAGFAAGARLSEREGVLVASDRPWFGFPGENGLGVVRARANGVPLVTGTTPKIAVPQGQPSAVQLLVTNQNATVSPRPSSTAGASTSQGQTQITVAQKSEVAGDQILLGEIATIDGGSATERLKVLSLGETPVIGARRVIDRNLLLAKLKNAGFKPESFSLVVPASAEVRRKSQEISAQTIVQEAAKSIESQGEADGYKTVGNQYDFLAPLGKLEIKSESVNGIGTKDITVVLGIYIDGKRLNSRTVKFTATQAAAQIRSGSQVKVVMKAGGAAIEIPGITRSAGIVGRMVTVEVQTGAQGGKTTHTGILVSPTLVEVQL